MRNPYISVRCGSRITTEHVLIAEKILGRALRGEEVHHVNGIGSDNRHQNLVICPDRTYHKLLHIRTEALDACGNAGFRKCYFCKKYGDPKDMINKSKRTESGRFTHKECSVLYERVRYTTKRRRRILHQSVISIFNQEKLK